MKKQLLLLFSILLLCSTSVISNEALIGSWQNDEGLKMDLMRGFKPNVGPVIYWEDEEVSEIQTWKVNPNSNELEIYYESGIYDISSDGNQLYWNTASWKDKEDLLWKKIDDIESKNVINIKKDPDAFVNILTSALWSSNV